MLRPYQSLKRKLGYLSKPQLELVHQAYRLAAKAHEGQRRETGESYISHPVAVAMILADLRMDHESIIAGLLHDVIEDTIMEKNDIAQAFGDSVADLVDGVTKLTQMNFKDRQEAQAEYIRKMILAMSNDIRVILVKLADRLHNLRTISICSYEKRERVAKETLAIFAPIAARLGMHELSQELKELGFMAWHPKRYRALNTAMQKARGHRKEMLNLIMKSLKEHLQKANLDHYELTGREKKIYSIYRKMKRKNVSFSEIMDVYGFRLLVNTVEDCYRALGIVHQVYRPRVSHFKDYIAIPKANGYQSLHTSLFGAYGVPIEIQIRTFKMEEVASNGIAAHWLYKTDESIKDSSQIRIQQWLNSILVMQQRTGSSLEFIENVKVDLFPDQVYVFTPKGRILELPSGSSVIDFAYAVHTDIGNECLGAKIDRRLMPLSTKLKSGQTIEVITSKRSKPSPMWLDFAVTGKAKSSIRHALKTRQHKDQIAVGEQLLKDACVAFGFALKRVGDEVWETIFEETKTQSLTDLCLSIGLGHRSAHMLANRIGMLLNGNQGHASETSTTDSDALVIQGTEGAAVTFANCCYPLPGDAVNGLINPGHGVTVHRESCATLGSMSQNRQRIVTVSWSDEIDREFTTVLIVQFKDGPGVLASMTSVIASMNISIHDIAIQRKEDGYADCIITLGIQNAEQCQSLQRALEQSKQVIGVIRQMNRLES